MKLGHRAFAVSCVIFASTLGQAQTDSELDLLLEEVLIIGSKDAANTVSGAANFIDEDDLDRFDQIDLSKVLNQVPGVYIREEDGYGLRPNIGIRGAAAERSQKVTILRDGVLITPAPYSAPAAYYVPNVSRISSVEVLKGPSAAAHGPHTVGGVINMASNPVPIDATGSIDLSAGSDGYYKGQASYGVTSGNFGYFIDVLTYGADGFKSVDQNGQSTGFERSDFGIKFLYQLPDSKFKHKVTLLIEGGDEDADETYLGLTDADFREDPYRRYAASQLAKFKSEHHNLLLNYSVTVSDSTSANFKVYWNEFDRSWNKLDGFLSGPSLQRVLQSPNQYQRYYSVLTGQKNSSGYDNETLDVTNNDRQFESSGFQWSLADSRMIGSFSMDSQVGVRVHNDQVERNHQPATYFMTDFVLQGDNILRMPKVRNRAETDAYAVYALSRFSILDFSLDLGVRHENIDGKLINYLTDVTKGQKQYLTAPSVSGIWHVSNSLSLFAGVYEGFSPAGPASGAENEESTNYELGLRFSSENSAGSITGFHSDYGNLIGRCRVSDTGCTPGSEFNGGKVKITGAEISAQHSMPIGENLQLELSFSYTYTESEFGGTFYSGFPQWGLVREGDELPYIPDSIGNGRISLFGKGWSLEASVDFQSEMREVPGIERIEEDLHSDDFSTVDVSFSIQPLESVTLQALILNATDKAAIVSHRPFGARPNRPRSLVGRIKYEF